MVAIKLRSVDPQRFKNLVSILSQDPEERWESMLTFEEKLILYESGYELESLIGEEKLMEFETHLALEGYFGTPRKLGQLAKESLPIGGNKT